MLPSPRLAVLQIEDQPDDAELVLRELRRAGYVVEAMCVDSKEALSQALTRGWDVIISDFRLAGFDAVAALEVVRAVDPDVPFIIVSGSIGEESAVEAMRAGAQDFFLKDRLHRLGAAVARETERARSQGERRTAVNELRDTRERLQALFDQAIVGIAQLDMGGRFVFANQTYCDLVGRSLSELLVLHDTDVVASDDAGAYEECLADVRRDGEPCALEVRYVRPSGEVVWVNASLSALRDAHRAVIGAITIVHDVTERRRIEAEREKLLSELAQTVELSQTFTGVLGHDLRNPLATILMSAAVLKHMPGYDATSATVDRIVRSAERMRRMIEQLLDFTRIRVAGGIPIERRSCDVATLAHQAIDEIVNGRGDADVRLEVRGATEGSWDRDRLLQLLSNLAINVVVHGDKGRTIRVAVDGTDEERVRVAVENAGHIPAEVAATLFEPLQASGGSRAQGGLGLGLFIVRHIARAHGGDALVTPTSDGTRFEIVLPRSGGAP